MGGVDLSYLEWHIVLARRVCFSDRANTSLALTGLS